MKETVQRVNQQFPQSHSTANPVAIKLEEDADANSGLKTFSFDDWEEWIQS